MSEQMHPDDDLEARVRKAIAEWSAAHPDSTEAEHFETVSEVLNLIAYGAEERLAEMGDDDE